MTQLTANETVIVGLILKNTISNEGLYFTNWESLFPNKFSPSTNDSQKTKSITKRLINKDFITREVKKVEGQPDAITLSFTQAANDFNSIFDCSQLELSNLSLPLNCEAMNKAYRDTMKPVKVVEPEKIEEQKEPEIITEPEAIEPVKKTAKKNKK